MRLTAGRCFDSQSRPAPESTHRLSERANLMVNMGLRLQCRMSLTVLVAIGSDRVNVQPIRTSLREMETVNP